MAATFTRTRRTLRVARALVESDGSVLLVRRAAWDSLPGQWELPGGKIDRGERVLQGLAREVEEETGLMLTGARQVTAREMISPRGNHIREHVYAAAAIGAVTLSDEHDAFAWVQDPFELELTDSAAAVFSLAS
jgi:8-oxo-dGTP diphosphatase